jgi:hypothetical protein
MIQKKKEIIYPSNIGESWNFIETEVVDTKDIKKNIVKKMSAKLIGDSNYKKKKNLVLAGKIVKKKWIVKNDGEDDWPNPTYLNFFEISGNVNKVEKGNLLLDGEKVGLKDIGVENCNFFVKTSYPG